jgi:2-iminobutanoate/2-iminopropanoate deaminase
MSRHEVKLGSVSIPLSPAVVAEGKFAYVSGQGPNVDGDYTPTDVATETRNVLANLERVLLAAGSSKEQVVRCGVFLVDMSNFDAMNAEYAAFFGDVRPARTTIQAAALPGGIQVEIDCVALVS